MRSSNAVPVSTGDGLRADRRGKPRKEIRTFSTLTRDLEVLRDWLKELGVTHVGMESTGIY